MGRVTAAHYFTGTFSRKEDRGRLSISVACRLSLLHIRPMVNKLE